MSVPTSISPHLAQLAAALDAAQARVRALEAQVVDRPAWQELPRDTEAADLYRQAAALASVLAERLRGIEVAFRPGPATPQTTAPAPFRPFPVSG
ncbi:hypothetical protein [Amycolatopsis minnesotensis]|uniref:Uncharacterized protein n=1 Tax=Amycolatopsis minnesotensis TaxID=337894 RepID=A0ABN2SGT8_9PSEU